MRASTSAWAVAQYSGSPGEHRPTTPGAAAKRVHVVGRGGVCSRAVLAIELNEPHERHRVGEPIALAATYVNTGATELALAFWWQRSMRVRDAEGREVAPGPGPVLPCGIAEELTILQPGERHARTEPLACTQPAGTPARVGWSFALAPGTYSVTLVLTAPPPHGFMQHTPDAREFRGRVESNPVRVVVEAKPPGLLARLLGR